MPIGEELAFFDCRATNTRVANGSSNIRVEGHLQVKRTGTFLTLPHDSFIEHFSFSNE